MAVQSDKLRLLRRIPQIRFEEELRGYSKSQVDRVLENLAPLADEIEVLQQHLAEAEQRAASAEASAIQTGVPAPAVMDTPAPVQSSPQPPADFDEQLREVMLMAQRTAKERVETAEADAEQIRAESKSNADSLMASARTEAQELRGEAHAQREQMLSDAEEERAALLESANADAEERRQAVEAQLVESEGALRDDLLVEIKELRDKRTLLVEDLSLFENHLGTRREAVKAALGEIDDAINDPSKLRENEVIEAAEVDETDEAALTEISVESEALTELSGEAAKARDALAAASKGQDGPSLDAADVDVVDGFASEVDSGEWIPPEVTPLVDHASEPDMFSTAALNPVTDSSSFDAAPGAEVSPDSGGEGFFEDDAVAAAMAQMDPLAESTDDQLEDRPQGFFDTSRAGDGAEDNWDSPPPPVEEQATAQAPEQTSRGGLLSGLLGGRRSADPTPEADKGEYLPPPTAQPSEAMSGLRSRLSGGEEASDQSGAVPTDPPSLAEAAMNAVTEAPPEMASEDPSEFGASAPLFDAPAPESSSPFGDLTRQPAESYTAESFTADSPIASEAPQSDAARPAWTEAVPEGVASPEGAGVAGSGDQYLEELRRVTGDDAVHDEDDEALSRFLSEDEDQGGGWFGRRK